MTNIWRSLLLALAVLLIIAGCGQDNDDNSADSFVQGANSDVVAVRIVGNFPTNVTQFRATVLSSSAQLLGQQTTARNGAETNIQISGIPRGQAIVRVEALAGDGTTQSFYQVPVSVPLAEGFLVTPSTGFVTGPAPSPTPIPSPGTTPSGSPSSSPSSSPSASPSSSPSASPSGSPSASPSSSPSASPSSSPSASPSSSPSASPSGSPSASPSSSPSASPSSSPSASPSGSPAGTASPSPRAGS